MRRRLLLVAAVLPLAACSTGTPGTPVAGTPQPANTTIATATTAAIQHGHDAGAKLTAACPLLTADELTQLLGGRATKLTATEAGVDGDSASPIYSCRYGADGKHPFETSVGKIDTTGITFSAKDAVDAFAGEGSGVHRLDGIGEDAVFLKLSDGTAFAATATHTHGELRTATFAAPGIVPQQVMATVLKTLAGRL